MSTDRLADYTGRHWALKEDEKGIIVSVHHFDSFEIRDAWVAMDPRVRIPVSPFHPNVKTWINANRRTALWLTVKLSWWRRILKLFRIIS